LASDSPQNVLPHDFDQLLFEVLAECFASFVSDQGTPESPLSIGVLKEGEAERERVFVAFPSGSHEPSQPFSGTMAAHQLFQVAKVNIKGRTSHARAFYNVSNGDGVVSALQDEGDEGLPKELVCPLHPSILKIRGFRRHDLGRYGKVARLSPASRNFTCSFWAPGVNGHRVQQRKQCQRHMSDTNHPSGAKTPSWVKLLGVTVLLLILTMGLLHLKHLRRLVGLDRESPAHQTAE
jgi:hypothetical protein